jgi:hypothetical protein
MKWPRYSFGVYRVIFIVIYFFRVLNLRNFYLDFLILIAKTERLFYGNTITPIQKLDTILYVISLSQNKNVMSIKGYINANSTWDVTDVYIQNILDRLLKDGYAKLQPSGAWTITFDGEVFKDAGGYNAKSLANAADAEQQRLEISRLKSVDVSTDLNQKTLNKLTCRLVRATWWAFGAALFAGLIV